MDISKVPGDISDCAAITKITVYNISTGMMSDHLNDLDSHIVATYNYPNKNDVINLVYNQNYSLKIETAVSNILYPVWTRDWVFTDQSGNVILDYNAEFYTNFILNGEFLNYNVIPEMYISNPNVHLGAGESTYVRCRLTTTNQCVTVGPLIKLTVPA